MSFAKPLSFVSLVALMLLTSCGALTAGNPAQFQVVATTQIVGDVVRAVGGDAIALTVLMPPDADPHAFEPTPRDAAVLSEADLIFANGLNLEESLHSLLETDAANVVYVSDGVPTIEFAGDEHEKEDHPGGDPHTWMNPLNVKFWVDNIVAAFSQLDPDNAAQYQANGEAYKAELDSLDAWAQEQIAQIPADQRILVTDHEAFGYFAQHYGFTIVGAIIPSYSTLSEPAAGELAALETAVEDYNVSSIFVSTSVNPALAERVASDTSVLLVALYTGSLSAVDGPAPTYLDLIRYDVQAIVGALK